MLVCVSSGPCWREGVFGSVLSRVSVAMPGLLALVVVVDDFVRQGPVVDASEVELDLVQSPLLQVVVSPLADLLDFRQQAGDGRQVRAVADSGQRQRHSDAQAGPAVPCPFESGQREYAVLLTERSRTRLAGPRIRSRPV